MGQVVKNKDFKLETLKKRSDFLRVAAAGKKWISPPMIIQMSFRENEEIRVGYTASKKVGNAPIRNLAKRRLREVVRRVMSGSGKQGHDYVIIARHGIDKYPFDRLIRDMKWSLKRLHGTAHKNERNNNANIRGAVS